MAIKHCVSSVIYLVFIDSSDYKKSHLLKVEKVKTIIGAEIYAIPIEYANCKIVATKEEGMHTLESHYKSAYESFKHRIFSELRLLTSEHIACVSHDELTQRRKSLLLKKIQLMEETRASLILPLTHTYSVEAFSGRYATGHRLDDIDPSF